MELKKTLESSLDCNEIKPVNTKGSQLWIFTGKTDAEVETPILWPFDVKSWLNAKDPDAEKDWGKEEKGASEDEMVGWHHPLNGHKFEQILGYSEGDESLVCGSLWGYNESDTTEQQQPNMERGNNKKIYTNSYWEKQYLWSDQFTIKMRSHLL